MGRQTGRYRRWIMYQQSSIVNRQMQSCMHSNPKIQSHGFANTKRWGRSWSGWETGARGGEKTTTEGAGREALRRLFSSRPSFPSTPRSAPGSPRTSTDVQTAARTFVAEVEQLLRIKLAAADPALDAARLSLEGFLANLPLEHVVQ